MAGCDAHSGVVAKLENLEKSDKKQWAAIEKIQNRPPVWTTAVISLLTFLFGCSLTYAALAVKISTVAGN